MVSPTSPILTRLAPSSSKSSSCCLQAQNDNHNKSNERSYGLNCLFLKMMQPDPIASKITGHLLFCLVRAAFFLFTFPYIGVDEA